jgi:hypothetical protein
MIPELSTFLYRVNSSCFDYLGYNQATQELVCCFDSRIRRKAHPLEAYFFSGIPESVFGQILNADSMGRAYHELIYSQSCSSRLGRLDELTFWLDGYHARVNSGAYAHVFSSVPGTSVQAFGGTTIGHTMKDSYGFRWVFFYVEVSQYFPWDSHWTDPTKDDPIRPYQNNDHLIGKYWAIVPDNVIYFSPYTHAVTWNFSGLFANVLVGEDIRNSYGVTNKEVYTMFEAELPDSD